MVCTVAAGTQASYYLEEQAEYYTGGIEPSGVWCLQNELFGIKDGEKVQANNFRNLHEGLDLQGEPLGQTRGALQQRVTGYDLTFSAPKSVSVLWALADDKLRGKVEAAQEQAVRTALNTINDHAIFARRGKGGGALEKVALNAALFQHGEARAEKHNCGALRSDPQLHTHAVVLNVAQRGDGSWGALDGRHLFHWKMAAGATYRAALAHELTKRLGVEITETDEKGLFEIAGVPAEVRDAFSSRRVAIVSSLAKTGHNSSDRPDLAAHVAKTNRQSKNNQSETTGERDLRWRKEAEALGFSYNHVQACLDRQTPYGRNLDDRLIDTIGRLTETNSVFTTQDLVRQLGIEGVAARASLKEIDNARHKILRSDDIVALGRNEKGHEIFSTVKQIALEREVQSLARDGAQRQRYGLEQAKVIAHLSKTSLTGEQKQAVIRATTGSDICVVEGAAGAGKSFSLKSVAELYKREDNRVLGSAAAWKIANQLGEDCKIEARSTDSWLASAAHEKRFLDANTVLIVDEAGQLSSKQMHRILAAAKTAKAKVIFTGDQKQLQAIGAGLGLRLVAEQTSTFRIEAALRQRDQWARQAVSDFAVGRAKEAFAAFEENGKVHWASSEDAALQAVVSQWVPARSASSQETAIILAKTNAQVSKLNEVIRAHLKQAGELKGPDYDIKVASSSGRAAKLGISEGEHIRFTKRIDALGVINGTTTIISKVAQNRDGDLSAVVWLDNQPQRINLNQLVDEKGRIPIAHNYASTIYSAQGMTVDRAFVLADASFKRNEIYVAASRARIETQIILNKDTLERSVLNSMPLYQRTGMQLTRKELSGHLTKSWSRVSEKVNALEYLPEKTHSAERERTSDIEVQN
ncbi:MobF family relaxase [Flexibacterium corallicola]|uniref:MobF family relaxase n=1 Tax=Flexibacterium corallicola TaxID=3037259 RepID=UPI00286EDF1F|nr:MobF family relaxase [Pseudovibrio sp. M1P-2-3]